MREFFCIDCTPFFLRFFYENERSIACSIQTTTKPTNTFRGVARKLNATIDKEKCSLRTDVVGQLCIHTVVNSAVTATIKFADETLQEIMDDGLLQQATPKVRLSIIIIMSVCLSAVFLWFYFVINL